MIRHLLKLVWNRKRANALIVAEIFVSFLVVFGVLTALATLAANWRRPLGYDWRGIWDVRMESEVETEGERATELQATLERMVKAAEAMPEVESAALAKTPPYALSTFENTSEINGRSVTAAFDQVSDGYLRTMRMTVVRGRWFDRSDDGAAYLPIVVDENMARATWDDENPIGKVIERDSEALREELREGEGKTTLKVIGVVKEFRKDGETAIPRNMMFRRLSSEQLGPAGGNHIIVRLRPGTPAAFEEKLLSTLHGISPELAFRVRPMDQMRERSIRMVMAPLAVAGIVGLFLIVMVALGLTGVLWQNVTRRTREIGVRRALGASGANVHRQVLGEVVVLSSLALLLGAIVVLQLPILGVFSLVAPPIFAASLAGALAAIYLLTLLCALYPSWMASRLQPADALRYE